MSQEITTAFVQQYRSEVFHLSQQRGSVLQDKVRREMQNGKRQFFDRIGPVAAVEKTTRHSDTPQIDTPHSRRAVTLTDYVWADLIDDEDLRRMLIDPAGDYAMAAMWAFGRAKDDKIISAADGLAYGGEEGTQEVAHPNSQKIAAWDSGGFSGANVGLLRAVKKILDQNDVDKSITRYGVMTAQGFDDLLGEEEITSSDYNVVRALVQGEINTFMGFVFDRTERLNTQVEALSASTTTGVVGTGTSVVGHRKNIFWAQDGLLMTTAREVEAKIEPRPDKNYSTQVYTRMGIGSTRLEEAKVVIALTDEP
jgi:hypothetical protein